MSRLQRCLGLLGTVACAGVSHAQTVININAAANRHAINPNVYGIANTNLTQLQDLNSPLVRYGGDSSTTYNWLVNGDNRGADWYFESIGDTSAVQGERGDSFLTMTRTAGAQGMITIPMLPYVAKLGSNRSIAYSFSIKKYGAQTGFDPYLNDSGNGILASSGNPYVSNNNPLDAFVPSTAATQLAWIKHITQKWGKEASGGLKYYIMDNEPSIWHGTHRDAHPVGEKMDEIFNDYVNYAGEIRTNDAGAVIVGPEEWGWTGYFYSGFDQQYGAQHGWGGPFPDQTAHGNMSYVPWLLQQLHAYQTKTKKQLLNVFSLHYYPQQGEFGNDDSAGMQAIRNRSTRSLWDPNYVDTSWINSVVDLIPRMKGWVNQYYPGLQTGITEYNWGDESNLNGATTQADLFGIFGQQGLDMACRWGAPATNTPTYLAMKMYRNYDGELSGFGDTSVSCSVPNPDNLSAFASVRTVDGAMTIMVVNKVGTASPVQLNISGFKAGPTGIVYQLSSASQTSIPAVQLVTTSGGKVTGTVPAQSVSLIVIPASSTAPEYDFETGTQGWTYSGAPITSLADSKTQHESGSHSLAVNISASAAGSAQAYVSNPILPAGKTVTFHVWIPTGSKLTAIQPYVQQGAAGNWTWTGTYVSLSKLKAGAWNTVTVAVPANAVTPLFQLGVQFTTSAKWSGTCYVDAVSW